MHGAWRVIVKTDGPFLQWVSCFIGGKEFAATAAEGKYFGEAKRMRGMERRPKQNCLDVL